MLKLQKKDHRLNKRCTVYTYWTCSNYELNFFYHFFFLLLKQTFRSPKRYMIVHVYICLGDLRSQYVKRIFNIQKFICDCQSLTRCNYTITLCKKHIEK